MNQEWREVKGFPGYFVNRNGQVKGLYERVLKPQLNTATGYYHVNVRRNKVPQTKAVHRIVAEAFITNESNHPQVNHKDGDKTNNYASNLEWVSASDNRKHAYSKGLFDQMKMKEKGIKAGKGALDNLGKIIVLTDAEGEEYRFPSIRQACKELNLDRKSLSSVLQKKKHYHTVKGYKARYERKG